MKSNGMSLVFFLRALLIISALSLLSFQSIPTGLGIFKINEDLPNLLVNSYRIGFNYSSEEKIQDYEIIKIKKYKHPNGFEVDFNVVTKKDKIIAVDVFNNLSFRGIGDKRDDNIAVVYNQIVELFGNGRKTEKYFYCKYDMRKTLPATKVTFYRIIDQTEKWSNNEIEILYRGNEWIPIKTEEIPKEKKLKVHACSSWKTN